MMKLMMHQVDHERRDRASLILLALGQCCYSSLLLFLIYYSNYYFVGVSSGGCIVVSYFVFNIIFVLIFSQVGLALLFPHYDPEIRCLCLLRQTEYEAFLCDLDWRVIFTLDQWSLRITSGWS